MQRQSLQLEPILELVKPTINGYKTCFGSVGPSRRSCSFFIFLFLLENSNILFLLGFSFGCKLLEQASCRLANCIAILGIFFLWQSLIYKDKDDSILTIALSCIVETVLALLEKLMETVFLISASFFLMYFTVLSFTGTSFLSAYQEGLPFPAAS